MFSVGFLQMYVVRLKVLSILFIVYLTVFCYSCHSSRSEIGLSPQWSSNPLIYLHNFPHQSLYCQPDLSQLLGKKISVAPRNPSAIVFLQHHHGPRATRAWWFCRLALVHWELLECAGIKKIVWYQCMCRCGSGGIFEVLVLGFFSVWSWQPLHFFHMLSSTVCPTESCRAQFGLFVTKHVSSPRAFTSCPPWE